MLVASVGAQAKVPTEVSLLDYAGFRYDADLKARPSRWDDMARSVAFARTTETALARKSLPRPLAAKVDSALAAMADAGRSHDGARAAAAAKRELDLVDELEKYYSA